MPKGHGVLGSSQRPSEGESETVIRASTLLLTIPQESEESSSSLIASLVSEMDSIQSVVRHHASQLLEVIRQLRSRGDGLKKI